MKERMKILATPVFLAGLVLLLLNDFFLKEAYGSWFTGKLSDFAGLFIFPLFWAIFFPKHKIYIYFLTALLFIYWKSPYSEPLITTWNHFISFQIGRVVDYTDLIALLMLPLAYLYAERKNLYTLRIDPVYPLVISAFAFVATEGNKATKNLSSDGTNQVIDTTYFFNFSKDTLLARMYTRNIPFAIEDTGSQKAKVYLETPELQIDCFFNYFNEAGNKSSIYLKNCKYYVLKGIVVGDKPREEFEKEVVNKVK